MVYHYTEGVTILTVSLWCVTNWTAQHCKLPLFNEIWLALQCNFKSLLFQKIAFREWTYKTQFSTLRMENAAISFLFSIATRSCENLAEPFFLLFSSWQRVYNTYSTCLKVFGDCAYTESNASIWQWALIWGNFLSCFSRDSKVKIWKNSGNQEQIIIDILSFWFEKMWWIA